MYMLHLSSNEQYNISACKRFQEKEASISLLLSFFQCMDIENEEKNTFIGNGNRIQNLKMIMELQIHTFCWYRCLNSITIIFTYLCQDACFCILQILMSVVLPTLVTSMQNVQTLLVDTIAHAILVTKEMDSAVQVKNFFIDLFPYANT